MFRSLTLAALATLGMSAHGSGFEETLEAQLGRELAPLEQAVEPASIELDGSYLLAIVETPNGSRPTYSAYVVQIASIPESAQRQSVGTNDPYNVPRELATDAFDAYAEAIWIRVPDGASFDIEDHAVKIIYFEDLDHANTGLIDETYHANTGTFKTFAHGHRDVYNRPTGSER